MKRYVCLVLAMLTCLTAWAQRVTLTLEDETLASALRLIDHAQHERRIVFVLDDLDSIRVTRNIFHRPVLEAVQEVCEGHPILITECGADILVEYIRPPVRLLPNATITRRQLREEADGYTVRLRREGLTGHQLLLLLPQIAEADDGLLLGGQPVQACYVDGERLADASELRLLPSEWIDEVRVSYRTRSLYVTLRRQADGGYSTSLSAEGEAFRASTTGHLGGLWYSRYGRFCLYDRLEAGTSDVAHDISQTSWQQMPAADAGTELNLDFHERQLTTEEQSVANRLSLTCDLSDRSSLGLSYYVDCRQGNAQVQRRDDQGFVDFVGRNERVDQELTLRYTSTFGSRQSRLEALADYYLRQTASNNLSLYGSGVGTEMGEAPSLAMWKVAAEVHHPLSDVLALYAGSDLRYLMSQYDPVGYLSNFAGSPALLYPMDQHGLMGKLSTGVSSRWQRLQMEAGVALQYHRATQEIRASHPAADDEQPCDYHQGGLYPYLQLHLPVDVGGQHRLTFSYQRDLEDIPYAAMSPAVRWSDAHNYSTGNRRLRSPEVERWMLNASGWEGRLCLTASYLAMRNEIYWQTAVSSGQTDVFYTQPVNLSSSHLWLLQAEGHLRPTARWQSKVSALWQLRPEDNVVGGTPYHDTHLRREYSCRNLVDYGRGWKLSLNATYVPRYHLFDRTYYSRHSLQGEVQKSCLSDRLQAALTFEVWTSDRRLDRSLGSASVSHRYHTAVPHIGARLTWKLEGGRRVKVDKVDGGQHYREIREEY